MANITAQEAYQKWGSHLTNSVPDVKSGVMRVTESPTAKAAAKEDKWFAGITRAKNAGKFKRGLLAVSLDEWKTKTADVGADRIPAGVAAAERKSVEFYNKLLPFEDKLAARIRQMPDTTIQDSVQRATAWILGMAEFDRTK